MKKFAQYCLLALSILTLAASCGGKGGNDKPCSEAAMSVSTDPAIGSTATPAPGPNFPLQVNISANLPAAGVTIQVTATPEAGGNAFFTQTLNDVKTAVSNFSITNTPVSTTCKVDITITSKSCSNNKWTGSYRYSRK